MSSRDKSREQLLRDLSKLRRKLTRVKKAEAECRESEARLSAFVNSATEAFTIWDEDLNLVDLNPTAMRYFPPDTPKSAVIGKNILDFVPYIEGTARYQRYREIVRNGGSYQEDGLILYPGPNQRYLDLRAFKAGEGLGMITSDITERKKTEEALKESEERWRSLVQHAPNVIVNIGPDGTIRYINRTVSPFTPDEVIGRSFFEFLVPESHETVARVIRMVFESGEPSQYETRGVGPDGTVVWWETQVGPILQDQRVVALTLVSTDITERKRAEEALKESEERFRSLVENSADGIAIIRADGTLANIGPSNERVLGYEMDRAPGLVTMFDRVHPADHPKLARRFELLLRDSKSVNSAEFRIQRKDGTWQTIEVTGKNLLDNPVIQGIVVNFRDITERKRAEEALKESEEKYRQLFESVSDVVYSLDTEFRFLSVSPSVQQALGYAPEELIGKSFTDMNLLPIEDLKLAAQDAVSILAGEEVTRTYGFIAKDGSTRIGEIKGAPLIREGRISGVIAVARDITERVRAEEKEREAERLREMDRMRTDLLANVSHELRTPLTTIKGYATMLSEFPEELAIEERKGYLETIELSADRLNELVESLLDMSRIDAGMLRIDRRPSDISRLLRQAAAEAQVRSPVHIIVTNLARDLPVVSFDPKRIRQVVDNIIDNAIKYSAQGTTIRVEGTLSGANILISVADQGMGIPANELDRVFERMYRLRRDAEAQVSGVGLGLSICRGVVDAHGGKIWAESVEGRGTTCFFTLPLVTDESILDQHRGG